MNIAVRDIGKTEQLKRIRDTEISKSKFGVCALVVRAQEDWAIAREVWKLASA